MLPEKRSPRSGRVAYKMVRPAPIGEWSSTPFRYTSDSRLGSLPVEGLRPEQIYFPGFDGNLVGCFRGEPLDDGKPLLARIDARAAVHEDLVEQVGSIVGGG